MSRIVSRESHRLAAHVLTNLVWVVGVVIGEKIVGLRRH